MVRSGLKARRGKPPHGAGMSRRTTHRSFADERRISRLPSAPLFAQYYGDERRRTGGVAARRVVAAADRGFPCRITLDDAAPGESMILLNHISHDVANPYRSAYAIYRSRERRARPAVRRCLPPVFAGRTLSLRGFDARRHAAGALLAAPGGRPRRSGAVCRPGGRLYPCPQRRHGCFAARSSAMETARDRSRNRSLEIADDEAWAAVHAPRPALRRALRHRRAHHRHLLPPVVRRAPPEARERPLLRRRRRGARRRACAPACAAGPTTSPATRRRCARRSRLIEAAEEPPSLDELAARGRLFAAAISSACSRARPGFRPPPIPARLRDRARARGADARATASPTRSTMPAIRRAVALLRRREGAAGHDAVGLARRRARA